MSSNSDDVELEIESGQRISIENSNFTRIDDIQLDSKDRTEMDNRNIKKLSMTKAAADGDKSKRMTDLSDVDLSTDIDDEIQEDVGEEDNESLSKALSIEQKGSSQQRFVSCCFHASKNTARFLTQISFLTFQFGKQQT